MDVLIIGAGPAGLSASIELASEGIQVGVVDEYPKPGGRLLGQLYEEKKNSWWDGQKEAEKLTQQAEALGVHFYIGVSVHHMTYHGERWYVHTSNGTFSAKALLIATGATERSLPVPGWTLPGVMTIGAAQVMTNVHHVRPGQRGAILGLNALSFAIARELTLCGIDIEGFYVAPPHPLSMEESNPKAIFERLLQMAHLAPSPLLRLGGIFAKRSNVIKHYAFQWYPSKGMSVFKIPVHVKQCITEITGENEVQAIKVCRLTANGDILPHSERIVDVDFVCIAGGLSPLNELIALTPCPVQHVDALGGFIPDHFEDMSTPVRDLYVAGNCTGIESAKVAKAQGTVAGRAILKHSFSHSMDDSLSSAMHEVREQRKNALLQFHHGIEQAREEFYKQMEAKKQHQKERLDEPV
ncbi:NAD(P)/FAD-dependent oxidoreductase [Aureibacillus halotolerans]|uniref:Sarcosine oxidase subunit alpha n=1 Tax=Aureibacillus halotolerans TaxID=1508390 RepID=A0A4R6TR35_9BACI|nr:NAD(P)/FAD-dependent oxidoreductase [Aureibacillus halotolerans]TDQ35449.1 sarcosine oxidase subunit alpha [Aureibacillus halotolerans]